MAFVRTKNIDGHLYKYLVESYRDPETGKVRQRHLQYLGKVGEAVAPEPEAEPPRPPVECIAISIAVGDWVECRCDLGNITGNWEILTISCAGRLMLARKESGYVGHIWLNWIEKILVGYQQILVGYQPTLAEGTIVQFGDRPATVVAGVTNGADGPIPYANADVVHIDYELMGQTVRSQVPRAKIAVG